MANGVIYMITNLMNSKVYVGQSWNASRRMNEHFKGLRCNKHENVRMQNDWNSHPEHFGFSLLEWDIHTQKQLDKMEDYWFAKTQCLNEKYGYNLREAGGHGGFNDEVIEQLRQMAIGERNGMYGRKHTEESRQRMRGPRGKRTPPVDYVPWNKGKKMSEEQKKKMSDTKKRYWTQVRQESS